MDGFSWTSLAIHLAMGFSLAAVVGIRAFTPLLAAGLAARWDLIPLGSGFSWLQSNEALLILGAATAIELLGDKIPTVDHLLDAAGLVVKPVAGCLVMAAPLLELDTKWATLLGLLTGSTVAGAVHLARAQLRVVSTVSTAGIGNPILSSAEDLIAGGASVLAILLPILAFFAAAGLLLACSWAVLRRLRRRKLPRKRLSSDSNA